MSVDYAIRDEYVTRFSAISNVADNLKKYLDGLLKGVSRIDAISARAKDPDSYFAKAVKPNGDGSPKYSNPRYEIQDQIGARVTVFYLEDVNRIRGIIVKNLRFIEEKEKKPESESEFGYFGLHFIIAVPSDIVPDEYDDDVIPEFFELQIKTLFQHAWSEAHHDLGYKAFRDLLPDEKRRIAFSAAQAWGADNIFQELVTALAPNDNH